MRPPNRIILTFIVAAIMLSFLTGNAQAADTRDKANSLSVSIQSASYLDLDNDMIEDDILTVFTLDVSDGAWMSQWTLISMELELPSGYTFGCNLLVIGYYSRLCLTLGWYNTAIEAGWYTFSVSACMLGANTHTSSYDSMVFDPPTEGGPGSPVLEVISVVSS
jgi:hypothetical protein